MRNLLARWALSSMLCGAALLASAQTITVSVDGQNVAFDQPPVYKDGRVLVPLRGVFEEMGAIVEWDAPTRTVSAGSGSTDIRLVVGARTAWVNGVPTTLDVPAQIVGGRTMVPLRFLSESLGATVLWHDTMRHVDVTTAMAKDRDRDDQRQTLHREVRVNEDTVLPVRLNRELGSATSREGDRFQAALITEGQDDYAGLPKGTRIAGQVKEVRPMQGKDPGILELEFTDVVLPDGRKYPLVGSLIDLDGKDVTTSNGVITAKATHNRDQRVVYAGYGAGAGLIVGLLTKKPLEGALVGGLLGWLVGEVDRAKQRPSNVTLEPGTTMGVVLHRDLVVRFDSGR